MANDKRADDVTTAKRHLRFSPLKIGLKGVCPRCGVGKLFKGRFLSTLLPECDNCGLDYSFADAGDGPAYIAICIIAVIATVMAVWLEFTYEPAFWLQMLIWTPFVLLLSMLLLRPIKGWLIAIQYKYDAREVVKHDLD